MNYNKDGMKREEFVLGSDLDPKGAAQLSDALKLGIRKATLERIADAMKMETEEKNVTVRFFMEWSQDIPRTGPGEFMVKWGDFFGMAKEVEMNEREQAEFEIVRMSVLKMFK